MNNIPPEVKALKNKKVKTINIFGGKRTLVDAKFYPFLNMFTWYLNRGYAKTTMTHAGKSVTVPMHRMLTRFSAKQVDHINRDKLDNRLCNLRLVTPMEQSWNRSRVNRVGYRGVSLKASGTYSCVLKCNGIAYAKHGFKTAREAAVAYDKLSWKHHRQFGLRNFVDAELEGK